MTTHIPYFSFSNQLNQKVSAGKVIEYLSRFDTNLNGDNLFKTIQFSKNAFQGLKAEEIKVIRQPGNGLILDGYLPSSTLSDGFRAINRRGYYQIAGEPELVDIEDNKGRKIPSWRAPTLYTEGEGKPKYADVMNVGPLINEYGFGFDFTESTSFHCFHKHSRAGSKKDFLTAIRDKVFYVLEQVSLEDPNYTYRPKHTVWLMFPTSSYLFLNSLDSQVAGTEYLQLNRS